MAKDKDDAAKPKDPVKKLRKLLKNIRVAMLTTSAPDGSLRSRPMATPDEDFDGELWFFTRYHSGKTEEIQDQQKVNVSFAAPKNERFVSVSGTATVVRDPARIKDLWSREYKEWFPDGKKDPDLALLRVTIDRAAYWDRSECRMVEMPLSTNPDTRGPHRRPDPDAEPAQGGAQG